MTKHALNAFLAMSVTFINELAAALRARRRRRQGSRARPEERAADRPAAPTWRRARAFAGGTLARDVAFLIELGREHGDRRRRCSPAFKPSNDAHQELGAPPAASSCSATSSGQTVAVLGLTYKPGTDTLRRSCAVELCRWLLEQGATRPRPRSGGPRAARRPAESRSAAPTRRRRRSRGADALVVATEWPEFRELDGRAARRAMTRPLRARRRPLPRRDSSAGDPRVTLRRGRTAASAMTPCSSTDARRSSPAPTRGSAWPIAERVSSRRAPSVMLCARDRGAARAARATSWRALARPGQRVLGDARRRLDARRRRARWSPRRVARAARTRRPREQRRRLRPDGADRGGRLGRVGRGRSRSTCSARCCCCRARRCRICRRSGYGKIVNLSGGGATKPLPRLSAYAASKAAVVRFAETLARGGEATTGIDVNAIAPGALNTRLLDEVLEAGPDKVGRGVLRARAEAEGRRRHAAREGRRAGRVPRVGRERRHHRPADQRRLGPVARAAGAARASSTPATSTPCAASSPRTAGRTGTRRDERRDRRLRPDRAEARARRSAAHSSSPAPTSTAGARAKRWPRSTRAASRADDWRDGGRARRTSTSSIVATTNDALAPVTLAAVEAGKHVLVEKPAARNAAELEPVARRPRERAGVRRQGRLQPPLPPGASARRARSVDAGALGAADVHPRPLRPRRPARLRQGVARRPEHRRRRRAARPGRPPDRPVALVPRRLRRRRGHVAHATSGTCRSRTTASAAADRAAARSPGCTRAAPSGRTCSRFEIFGRDGKLQIDGLGGSYGVERLTFYQMLPRDGPARDDDLGVPRRGPLLASELEAFAEAIAARRPPPVDCAMLTPP